MQCLNDLVTRGKVLYLGVPDTPAWVVSKANEYARSHGLRLFVVYQGMWNACMRDFERDIIPMVHAEGIGLAPYGVLNQGRFQTRAGFEARDKEPAGRTFIPTSTRDRKVSAVLEDVASHKDCELIQVALAYCLQKAPYVFPIVGGRKVGHVQSSIDGLAVDLTEDEVAEIEKAYPLNHVFPHTFLSGFLFEGADANQRMTDGSEDVALTKGAGQTIDSVARPVAIRPPKKG
ncbi:hypothetical protein HKX48_002141 [Thoreauomyces humboldtii]|nr:hypothetical protein HKX48_002141 [Thoreauomyces humboldtii]